MKQQPFSIHYEKFRLGSSKLIRYTHQFSRHGAIGAFNKIWLTGLIFILEMKMHWR